MGSAGFAPPCFAFGEDNPPYECSPPTAPFIPHAPACVYSGNNAAKIEPDTINSGEAVVPDAFCQPVALPAITESEAARLYQEFAASAELPFRFLNDGCQARAQKMAQILLSRNLKLAKIFIKGRFELDNPHDVLWPVKWQYHVAPLVAVRAASGKTELRVLDPSLFAGPVSPQEFVARFRAFRVSRIDEIYFTSPFIYELNHRSMPLQDFRPEDMACMESMLRTGRSLQDLQKKRP